MKAARSLSNSLFLLLSIAGAVLFSATPASANSGDWSLVSAPPPPGPYRTVNLDPRVPGAEGIPMIGNTPGFAQPGESRVPPVVPDTAPAAGGQTGYQAPMQHLPPQVPGRYQSGMPRPPVNTWPGPARYPANVGRQNY